MLKRLVGSLNVALVLGFCILCSLASYGLDTLLFLNRAQPAVGTVVGHRQLRGGTRLPTLRFQTADGRFIEFEANNPLQTRYTTGQEVPILYDPDKPEEAIPQAAGDWMLWLPPLLVGPIGLILSTLGLGLNRQRRRQPKSPPT